MINTYIYICVCIHIYTCLSARLRRKIKGKYAQMCIIYIYTYICIYNIIKYTCCARERERMQMICLCVAKRQNQGHMSQHPLVPSDDWPAIIPLVDMFLAKRKWIPCASFIPSWLHDDVSATGRNVWSAVTTPGSPQAFLANTMPSGTVPLDRTYQ